MPSTEIVPVSKPEQVLKLSDLEALADRCSARGSSILVKDCPHLASDLALSGRVIRLLLAEIGTLAGLYGDRAHAPQNFQIKID